jgi:hypothetical protein
LTLGIALGFALVLAGSVLATYRGAAGSADRDAVRAGEVAVER